MKPRRTSTEIVARFPFVEVQRHRIVRHDTTESEVVTFAGPDWVSVVPVTTDGTFVLVRQHRHGIDGPTMEVPGGIVDPGESPAAAAERELAEETGYGVGELVPLGWCYPNPVLQGNRHHMFLARSCSPKGEPHFDAGEWCEVVLWTEQEVGKRIRDGTISHSLVLLSLARAAQEQRERAAQRLDADCDPLRAAQQALSSAVTLVEQMEQLQSAKVSALARRLRPGLTSEDLRNPHDFPELSDTDWHFADGQLAGIQSVLVALRARLADG